MVERQKFQIERKSFVPKKICFLFFKKSLQKYIFGAIIENKVIF